MPLVSHGDDSLERPTRGFGERGYAGRPGLAVIRTSLEVSVSVLHRWASFCSVVPWFQFVVGAKIRHTALPPLGLPYLMLRTQVKWGIRLQVLEDRQRRFVVSVFSKPTNGDRQKAINRPNAKPR